MPCCSMFVHLQVFTVLLFKTTEYYLLYIFNGKFVDIITYAEFMHIFYVQICRQLHQKEEVRVKSIFSTAWQTKFSYVMLSESF